MKQTAVEWLAENIDNLIPYVNDDSAKKFNELVEQAKEMEKYQQGHSEEEVELIANEMVNWAIDNIGNPNPQSGKKFDEVLNKYKK
jgi:hypothetical protein